MFRLTYSVFFPQVWREGDPGPYVIYRRFKQFEQLHAKCKAHGLRVGPLPAKQKDSLFGFRRVQVEVVEERIPALQRWMRELLQQPGAKEFKFLQDWLLPLQVKEGCVDFK